MTDLQQALIAAGLKELTFQTADASETVSIEALPDSSLLSILTYGKRKANDTVNSKANEAKNAGESFSKAEALSEWVQSAKAGKLGTGAGGKRLSETDKAIREVLAGLLAQVGMSNKDTVKLIRAHGPSEAFRVFLTSKFADQGTSLTSAQLAEATAKYWEPLVETPVAELVAMRHTKAPIALTLD